MGRALMKKGRIELAIRHYTEALRINPDFAEAHSDLADALTKKGKFTEAIEHYIEALRINPNEKNAREGRKTALLLMGKSADDPVTAIKPLVP
jgi:tetratricopeptide (TPR) repeat protein